MSQGTRRVRLGLIGLGNNMLSHIRRLVEIPEVEIVGLVDPVPEMQARARERYPQLAALPVFDSDAAGKLVLVSYQRHTQPTFVKIKDVIASGTIGEVEFIQALQNQMWYASKFRTPELPWRVKKELSGGGQLNDSGSHLVDILLYVTDLEPEAVYATQQNFKLEVDVNSAITVRFKGGAAGNIGIVGQAPGIGGSVWEDVTIYGSKGALYYRMLGQPEFAPRLELRLIGRDAPVDLGDLPAGSSPDQNFVDAILGRDTVKSPAECGLRVMQLSEAAWKSAETGAAVDVASLRG